MRNRFIKFLKRNFWGILTFITIFALMTLMTGCVAKKKVTDNETTTTEKVETTTEVAETQDTNREIRDTLVVNIPEPSNENERKLIEGILQQLQTSKSSGTNSYRSSYDAETNRLLVEFFIAQTQNKTQETTTDSKSEKSFEQNMSEYIKKQVVPWWIYLIGLFFIRKEIWWLIKKLYPPAALLFRTDTPNSQ